MAATQSLRVRVLAKDVDAAARGFIEEARYGENFVARLGHGRDSEVPEQP